MGTWLIVCCTLAGTLFSASGQPADEPASLLPYTVRVGRITTQSWTGYGVYLGNGLVITAAHVVGWAFWNRPRVEIAGKVVPARVVKEGSVNRIDITLMSIEEAELPIALRLRRMSFCRGAPYAGEEVLVAALEGVVPSQVISPYLLPRDIPDWYTTVIGDVETGASGSGVFDADEKCLLGIISRKIWQQTTRQENGQTVTENHDIARYFVPAPQIADFLTKELRQ